MKKLGYQTKNKIKVTVLITITVVLFGAIIGAFGTSLYKVYRDRAYVATVGQILTYNKDVYSEVSDGYVEITDMNLSGVCKVITSGRIGYAWTDKSYGGDSFMLYGVDKDTNEANTIKVEKTSNGYTRVITNDGKKEKTILLLDVRFNSIRSLVVVKATNGDNVAVDAIPVS